ncbi:MAG: SpoIIE family protein phosphatase [Acidobacteria bacterium]|nr:SpoIIE family protein phosphatase [Acidobacteriota bacterium]
MENVARSLLEWGVSVSTLHGQSVLGDRHVIRPYDGGMLVAVIDGIGHGEEAAVAAAEAARAIETCAHESVIKIIRACHEALRHTRGVVMSLASFNAADQTMAWAGVGNVEGLLLRADSTASPASEMLLLRGGVVGHHLPPLAAAILQVTRGDTLILVTDGVGIGFWRGLHAIEHPQRMSDRILAAYATHTDDALVVTARYCG